MSSSLPPMASATSSSSSTSPYPSNHKQTKPVWETEYISRNSEKTIHASWSLKPTLVKPVQNRNQIKISPVSATKQKRKQHHIEERFKQTIVLQNSLIETLRAQISEKPHQCPECPKFFKRPDHVRSHIRRKHPTLVSSINNTYCEECEKHFTRPIYLAHHTCSPNSRCKYALLRCKMSILTRFSYSSFIPLWVMSCKLVFVVFSYSTHGIRKTPAGLKAFYGSGLELSL